MFTIYFIHNFVTNMIQPLLRPKHIGEEIVNKILLKNWREFCWLFIRFITLLTTKNLSQFIHQERTCKY